MEEEALLRCVALADRISSWCPHTVAGGFDPTYPYDGMADAGVRWNPYTHRWLATASWSSGAKVSGDESDSLLDAILALEIRLQEELGVASNWTAREVR
jgi:hypothetical protein